MSGFTVADLKARSGLPGPRGNLELFYGFLNQATSEAVEACLAELTDTTTDSPEEFVGMCGVAGFALIHAADEAVVVSHLRRYAAHRSWRIREAVAMAIQELPFTDLAAREAFTRRLVTADPFVHRAVVAGLCEPRNLKGQKGIEGVLAQLGRSTALLAHDHKLTEGEEALRKSLGYGWSVALVEAGAQGELAFEALLALPGRHVRWIVGENLKKNRLLKGNREWLDRVRSRLAERTNKNLGGLK